MEERDAGRSPEAALHAAAATSGRAVLVSGLTVMIAMAGMFFAGNATFVSFAIGTILVVAVAVIGSLTFLPAMLAWLGRKGWTEKGRVPYFGKLRHRGAEGSTVWGAILDRVLRRPLVSAVAAGGPARGAHDPRARAQDDQHGHPGPAARPRGHADLRPHPGRLPRRTDPRNRRRAGR
jgi:RND superfamily putative drug exporter